MVPLMWMAALSLLIAAWLLEGLALLLLHQGAGWIGICAAHVASAGLAAEALRTRFNGHGPDTQLTCLQTGWLLGLVLPLIGPAIVSVALVSSCKPGDSGAFSSWEAARSRAALEALEAKRSQQEVDADLDALVDALKDPNPDVRIAALDALRGDASPRAVQMFTQARNDDAYDVRLRAVDGLERIARQYTKRVEDIREQLATHSTTPELHLELAQASVEYAQLGIEDAATTALYLEQAERHSAVARRLGAGPKALLICARALQGQNRYQDAEAAYRLALACDSSSVEALIGIAEAQFLRKDFTSLRSTARWLLREGAGRIGEERMQSLLFWFREAAT